MSGADWLALALACAAGAMSPGPSLALVVRHASVALRQGVICALSHALGVGVYAALAVSGGALLLQSGVLATAIALAGSLWLLHLAWRLWRAPGDWQDQASLSGSAAREGLLMGLVNPKVALFFLAVFTAVLPAASGAGERTGAVVLAIGIDGAWYALVSWLVQWPASLGWLRRHAGLINRLSALIFGLLAFMLIRELLP